MCAEKELLQLDMMIELLMCVEVVSFFGGVALHSLQIVGYWDDC